MTAAVAVAAFTAAPAALAGDLLPNGSFESSLDGWGGWNSSLSRVSGGAAGSWAAQVRSTAGSDSGFSIYTSPRPVTPSPGAVYTAGGSVRSDDGAHVCLYVREWSSSGKVGSAHSCADAGSSWTGFPSVSYTAQGSGSLEVYAYAYGAPGLTFAVDGLTLASDAAPPADTSPPETTITSAPPSTTTDTSATFAFSASEAGSTFACRLDGSAWAGCTSPRAYSGLAAGSHSFAVRATDAAGNLDPTPATHDWTISEPAPPPPPPAGENLLSNPSFESSLDGWTGWNSSASRVSGGADGSWSARVVSSASGFSLYTSPRPVIPPEAGAVYTASGSVRSGDGLQVCLYVREWGASGALGSARSCTTAGSTWSGFPAVSYTGQGGSSLEVYAYAWSASTGVSFDVDGLSLVVSSAGAADTTPPETTISSGPSGDTPDGTASFQFTSSEAGSTFACRLDDGAWSACTSPRAYSGLAVGPHTFAVRATDAAGNVDQTPATRDWNVTAPPPTAEDPVLIAAGDQHACQASHVAETAQLVASLDPDGRATIATLGDSSGENGTADEYANCFDPTWGAFKARIRPTIGNHDWGTPGATGYFGYFGAAAGEAGKGWYSYDLGSWHVVVLSSYCGEVGGCGMGSPQVAWLKQDLAAHPAGCTLAYFHHPYFTSTPVPGTSGTTESFWRVLYANGVDVILNGHSHVYQRFAPQDPSGNADPNGIREFVVGTGGADLHTGYTAVANSEVWNDTTWGVLRLALHPAGYDWEFVRAAGASFTDSGSGSCH